MFLSLWTFGIPKSLGGPTSQPMTVDVEPLMDCGCNVTFSMVPYRLQGDIYPEHELLIEKMDYFSKYVTWNFLEVNLTHWRVTAYVDGDIVEHAKAVLYGKLTESGFKDAWFSKESTGKLGSHILQLNRYPLRALTDYVVFDKPIINYLNDTACFYMIFPHGFKANQRVRIGFGTVTISTVSLSPADNAQTLDTTPDFSCTPVSDKDATVNVTLYVDDVASGTVAGHTSNTEVTVTCNHTLTVDDDKVEWYFNVTDSDGTTKSSVRNIGIGAYFKVPVVLTNENATTEHWTYYLNASTSDYAVNKPIQIPDNNITMNGQYYTLDGDENLCNYGIYLKRDSETTTTITIENITVTDMDLDGIYLWKVDGNTLANMTVQSNPSKGIHVYYSDSNTLANITAITNDVSIYFVNSHSNTLSTSTVQDSDTYGVSLAYSSASNIFYNNLFNNTENVFLVYNAIPESANAGVNYWNTTRQGGTRIYSDGAFIGGNYWTNSSGTGYSDLTEDSNGNGFSDEEYELGLGTAIGNIDYLAYSDEYGELYQEGSEPTQVGEVEEKEEPIIIIPKITIPTWGYYVIFGSLAVVAVATILKKPSKPSRKVRGIKQKKRSRQPRNLQPRKRRLPKRSKRTGRYS